jgi:hypothetical protein
VQLQQCLDPPAKPKTRRVLELHSMRRSTLQSIYSTTSHKFTAFGPWKAETREQVQTFTSSSSFECRTHSLHRTPEIVNCRSGCPWVVMCRLLNTVLSSICCQNIASQVDTVLYVFVDKRGSICARYPQILRYDVIRRSLAASQVSFQ